MRNATVSRRGSQRAWQAKLWTALPGILESFDPVKMTAKVQAAIQPQVRGPQGAWVNTTISVCVDCPVQFQGGGGFVSTFPLAQGDEGLLVFASRCIDAWWQSGGVQPMAELRMHDLSDGFFLPGVFSQPRVPAGGASTTTYQTRSLDGENYFSLQANYFEASVASGAATLTVDGIAGKVDVVALAGLWVNGVRVTVP